MREAARKAKALPRDKLPEAEDGDIIDQPFLTAHYLEAMMRWGGMWLIAMGFFVGRLVWLICTANGVTTIGVIIFAVIAALAIGYLWWMALAVRRWVRYVSLKEAQSSDRRPLEARIRELDERERSLAEREEELDQRELNVREIEKALDDKVMTEEQRIFVAERKKTARQVAELAEIARELGDDDDRG